MTRGPATVTSPPPHPPVVRATAPALDTASCGSDKGVVWEKSQAAKPCATEAQTTTFLRRFASRPVPVPPPLALCEQQGGFRNSGATRGKAAALRAPPRAGAPPPPPQEKTTEKGERGLHES